MDMNHPSEYITVMTSHSSPITHLEWLPSIHNGGFNNPMWLLSADLNDKICLWKSDDVFIYSL